MGTEATKNGKLCENVDCVSLFMTISRECIYIYIYMTWIFREDI